MKKISHRLTAQAPRRAGLLSALLLAFLLALGLLSLSSCKELEAILGRSVGGASHGISVPVPVKEPVVGMVADRKTAAPGSTGIRRLFKRGYLPPGGRLEWMPPLGASGFRFDTGDQPLPGGPPFVWNDISGDVTVYFRYSSGGDWGAVDTFTAYDAAGQRLDTVMNVTKGLNPSAASALSLPVAPSAADGSALGDLPSTIDAWRVARTFSPQDSTLNTDQCQQLVDWVQSDAVFFAMSLPISPTAYVTEAHRISLYPGDRYSSTLQLFGSVSGPTTPVITLPLTLRPERLNFAATSLPATTGYEWITIGAEGVPATCPAGLNLAPNDWYMVSDLLLDLSHQPGNCTGCVLPGYFCYEGQEAPLALGTTSYQGDGITCVGPEMTDLGDTTSWVMSGSSTSIVTPTQVISLPHFFYVPSSLGTIAFSLSMTSTLDVEWGFYEGTWDAPDLNAPISPPFNVESLAYFWLVSAPVPTTTVDGPYSVVLSATSVLTPSEVRWASDLVWVGGWVAPPLDEGYKVYLPLVVR